MDKKTYIMPETGVVESSDLMEGVIVFSGNNHGVIDGNEGGALAKRVDMDFEEEDDEEYFPVKSPRFKYRVWTD
ncbi:hypothetical protein [Prevotella koreensis]|uniref:hypothetical protein n=1 Tax=Prevotella koreensis TaxID=2490854 RepID=UPI0028E48F04|nr:hypothetical protein [Prevotella koreensis]